MAVLIRVEEDGSISFGNAALKEKSKQDDFSHEGDIYKVKTWEEITKLERNGLFAYESVPGTNVEHMQVGADRVSFTVSGPQDAEITLGLEAGCEYDIQIEFGDIGNILAYISIGDRIQDIERLVGALADIKRLYSRDGKDLIAGEYIQPELVLSPQEAFYSERRSLTLDESVGQVCGEFVMCYPPGIPILAPGERITREIVDYILFAKERGCSLQGTEDPEVNHINVIKRKEN